MYTVQLFRAVTVVNIIALLGGGTILTLPPEMQNVTTIATSSCVKFSGSGYTFKLNIRCFVINSTFGPYLAFFGVKIL